MKRKYPDRTKKERQNGWVKRKRKEIPLEISVEKRCCRMLDAMPGVHTEKRGTKGEPDRIVFIGDSFHVWFEFKRAKFGSLTPAQRRRFPEMIARGELIYIVKSANDGVEIVWRLGPLVKRWSAMLAGLPVYKEKLPLGLAMRGSGR